MLKQSIIHSCLLLILIISGCAPEEQYTPKIIGKASYMNNQTIQNINSKSGSTIQSPNIQNPYNQDKNTPAEWIPPAWLENKKRWEGIVIHHSAASYGSALHEHISHKDRGFDGLGYHFVINNGVRKNGYGKPDGLVEVGYRWKRQQTGSHCRANSDNSNYWNVHSIGICLIGDFEKTYPSFRQMQSLVKLVRFLQQRYNIPKNKIFGHREIKPTKCPGKNFSIERFKKML